MSENGRADLYSDGFGAAEEVFERVLANLEGLPAEPATNRHTPPKASRVRLTQVRSAAARTLDLYGELFQRAFETYADLAQAALQSGGDSAPDAPLTLSGRPGGDAVTPLWLHNLSADAVDDVELFLTGLTAPTGERIEPAAARFQPVRLPLGAGESASAVLQVAIPRDAPPGVYHGHVLSPALPHAALGIRLEVEP